MSAAIVTGAAGAIGRAIALKLSASRPVICVDMSDDVDRTCGEIISYGGTAARCVVDLTADEAPVLISELAGRVGGASILVNNAGITRDARATRMSGESFRAVLRVNAVAPLRLAEELAPRLEDGGSIVNVSSRAALGNFGQANYVAAKSALLGATRAFAVRWAPRLRVNSVAPGLVRTPMTEAMPTEVLDKLIDRIPAGRAAEPEDIAEAVEFLAGEKASYVTGQMLLVCGGRSVAG
ncbi:MAG TPA: SDR family NAD(P)-dependent oxidoreductase [Solirubrobacterales bacterium]|nr:SDR family NAD(P)-dependent oxidoreductase [Solirubrobacterales bacterium]